MTTTSLQKIRKIAFLTHLISCCIQNIHQRTNQTRFQGPIPKLCLQSVNAMSLHLFHFRWQAMQFDECKKQLWEGDDMFIMDFSTNYSHHKQGEIHGAFWCRRQTTFHPIITYYLCPQKCDHLVCDEIMIVKIFKA